MRGSKSSAKHNFGVVNKSSRFARCHEARADQTQLTATGLLLTSLLSNRRVLLKSLPRELTFMDRCKSPKL